MAPEESSSTFDAINQSGDVLPVRDYDDEALGRKVYSGCGITFTIGAVAFIAGLSPNWRFSWNWYTITGTVLCSMVFMFCLASLCGKAMKKD